MTHYEIQNLSDIQLRIFKHIEIYLNYQWSRITLGDFILRCGLKMSVDALRKHFRILEEKGFIEKELFVIKPQLINGKWSKFKSNLYIKICKTSQCAPTACTTNYKEYLTGRREQAVGGRPERNLQQAVGNRPITEVKKNGYHDTKVYSLEEYASMVR